MGVPELLAQHHIRPRKGFSQNFLLDETVLQDAVQHAGLTKQSYVLEVGAGIGNLTGALAATGAAVTSFEVDRRFVPLLSKIRAANPNVEFVFGDFFAWFRRHADELSDGYRIVANLPYHMTAHFFRTVLESLRPPGRVVVLVQKEVAERICAKPGEMSLLALSVQLVAKPTFIRTVPRSAFFPKPKVDSALLLLTDIVRLKPDTEPLFRLARAAFSGKRKQLANSLASGLGLPRATIIDRLQAGGIQSTVRPQELSVEEWRRISEVL